mmetsp:Transcript_34050/g.78595  ORF Transcript_34050/g.78595 Transcript_34050/m.78595 type:complete len:213 (+) Transcript_34050:495-1133(+)
MESHIPPRLRPDVAGNVRQCGYGSPFAFFGAVSPYRQERTAECVDPGGRPAAPPLASISGRHRRPARNDPRRDQDSRGRVEHLRRRPRRGAGTDQGRHERRRLRPGRCPQPEDGGARDGRDGRVEDGAVRRRGVPGARAAVPPVVRGERGLFPGPPGDLRVVVRRPAEGRRRSDNLGTLLEQRVHCPARGDVFGVPQENSRGHKNDHGAPPR